MTTPTYELPEIQDFGNLLELTSSTRLEFMHGVQTVAGAMSFSAPAGGGQVRDFGSTGSSPTPGSGLHASAPGSGTGAPGVGGGRPPGTTGGGVASNSSSGRLPFTGLNLMVEGLVGAATISLGLALHRVSRFRRPSHVDPLDHGPDDPGGPIAAG